MWMLVMEAEMKVAHVANTSECESICKRVEIFNYLEIPNTVFKDFETAPPPPPNSNTKYFGKPLYCYSAQGLAVSFILSSWGKQIGAVQRRGMSAIPSYILFSVMIHTQSVMANWHRPCVPACTCVYVSTPKNKSQASNTIHKNPFSSLLPFL